MVGIKDFISNDENITGMIEMYKVITIDGTMDTVKVINATKKL